MVFKSQADSMHPKAQSFQTWLLRGSKASALFDLDIPRHFWEGEATKFPVGHFLRV